MKKVMMIVLALGLMSGILVGCGESDIQKVEGDNSAEQQKVEEKKQETLKIGDAVKFDGLKVKVLGVREFKGDQFFKPENDKFVLVQVEVVNTTNEPQTVSSMLQTRLMDAEGQSQDAALTGDEKGQLDGEIGPGRKLKGEVAFDVMKSDYYEFIFEDPFTTGQAIWKIDAKDIK